MNIRNYFFNLSDFLTIDWNRNFLNECFNSNLFNFNLNYLLYGLWNLYNFLYIPLNANNFLDNSIDGDGDFHWNNNLLLYLYHLANLMCNWNNFINVDFSWNLYFVFNNLVVCLFNNFNCTNNFFDWYNFLNYFFNHVSLSNVCVNWYFYNFDSFFEHWNLNYLFNFNDLSALNNSVNNFFNNLRYFYNLLDHSRHNYNFFNDFLDLYYLWYFNHLLDNLININSNLFNPLDCFWDLNNLFNCYFYWIVYCHLYNLNCLNFNDFWNLDNLLHILFYFHNNGVFNSLDNNLCDNFRYSHNSLLNNWNLYSPVYNLFHLSDDLDCVSYNSFNFFNSIPVNNFLLNNFDLFNSVDLDSNLNDFLNNFGYFNNSLDCLD